MHNTELPTESSLIDASDSLLRLRSATFDSLASQLAIIDRSGTIIDVNLAWKRFGLENGNTAVDAHIGSNYLAPLNASTTADDPEIAVARAGIESVLIGKADTYYCEYPCHSPDFQRWFMMQISPLYESDREFFVVSHQNITQRKLAEEKADFQSRHDTLTGIANRRYFNEALKSELRRSGRNGIAVCLLAIDIDHLKAYNDLNGHAGGDECIVNVAKILSFHARRQSDLAARVGGDEFILLLTTVSRADAHVIAEQVRREVEEVDMKIPGGNCVTVSVGVASIVPEEPWDSAADILLSAADRALYCAKTAGRNRVRYAPDGLTMYALTLDDELLAEDQSGRRSPRQSKQ